MPGKFVVPQGKEVAVLQKSFAGATTVVEVNVALFEVALNPLEVHLTTKCQSVIMPAAGAVAV